MHARRVVPDEERLVGLLRVVAIEEVDDLGRDFLIHGFRALQRQRPLVTTGLVLLGAVGRRAGEHRPRRRHAEGRLRIHRARDLGKAAHRRVLARRHDGLFSRGLVDVGEAYALHRVQVVEVAPEFLEAVRRRQRSRMVAQMVLAELAGGVAEVEQEPGQRRRAGLQEGRAAGQLRRDHAGAQRRHAGEEGGAPGRAALLGVVGHELRTLMPDTVDVGRLADHQSLMVNARLHPADVVAHDEQDVGLLARPGCRRGGCRTRRSRSGRSGIGRDRSSRRAPAGAAAAGVASAGAAGAGAAATAIGAAAGAAAGLGSSCLPQAETATAISAATRRGLLILVAAAACVKANNPCFMERSFHEGGSKLVAALKNFSSPMPIWADLQSVNLKPSTQQLL